MIAGDHVPESLPVILAFSKASVTKVPSQILKSVVLPATGAACSLTVTVTVASMVHGEVGATVYVYVPAVIIGKVTAFALASVQVPPASAPVRLPNRVVWSTLRVSVEQNSIAPLLVPASGAVVTVITTSAVSTTVHGEVGATVYVYVPAVIIGKVTAFALASVQVPPASAPVRLPNRVVWSTLRVSVEQNSIAPLLVPASGAVVTVITTSAVSATVHGEVGATVYVYVPAVIIGKVTAFALASVQVPPASAPVRLRK